MMIPLHRFLLCGGSRFSFLRCGSSGINLGLDGCLFRGLGSLGLLLFEIGFGLGLLAFGCHLRLAGIFLSWIRGGRAIARDTVIVGFGRGPLFHRVGRHGHVERVVTIFGDVRSRGDQRCWAATQETIWKEREVLHVAGMPQRYVYLGWKTKYGMFRIASCVLRIERGDLSSISSTSTRIHRIITPTYLIELSPELAERSKPTRSASPRSSPTRHLSPWTPIAPSHSCSLLPKGLFLVQSWLLLAAKRRRLLRLLIVIARGGERQISSSFAAVTKRKMINFHDRSGWIFHGFSPS